MAQYPPHLHLHYDITTIQHQELCLRFRKAFNGPSCHDLTHCAALTVFGANLDLLSVIMLPPAENERSDETDVAGIARKSRAMQASRGNRA
jgi:hypothetical protein